MDFKRKQKDNETKMLQASLLQTKGWSSQDPPSLCGRVRSKKSREFYRRFCQNFHLEAFLEFIPDESSGCTDKPNWSCYITESGLLYGMSIALLDPNSLTCDAKKNGICDFEPFLEQILGVYENMDHS